MNPQIFELTPTNGRKSFGGKAKVIVEGNVAKCLSYETIVAEFDLENNTYKENGYYSKTTTSHINAFKNYYGI